MDPNDPKEQMYLYFRVLKMRIHYAIAEWLYQLMMPAINDHFDWLNSALSDIQEQADDAGITADRCEDDIHDLENRISELEDDLGAS